MVGAVYALRYDEASRRDVMCAVAGVEEPPFVEMLEDELSGPIELDTDPVVSDVASLAAWADQMNAVLGHGR